MSMILKKNLLGALAKDRNIIISKAKEIKFSPEPLHRFIWKNLDKKADKTAVICLETGRQYTYNQLYKKSFSVSKFLRDSLKLRPKQTAAVILPNFPEYPIVLLGAVQAGLKVSPFNPNYTQDEIKRQLLNSEADVVFTSNNLVGSIQNLIKDIPRSIHVIQINQEENAPIINDAIDFKEISSGELDETSIDIDLNETLFLPYSSGTTGLPKGVELSHLNIVNNVEQCNAQEFNLLSSFGNDVVPAFLPFFHIYGLVIGLLHTLYEGSRIVTMPTFSSDAFVKLLKVHKPTVIYGVPSTVNMIINNEKIKQEDLASIRCVNSGAAPLGPADIERFHAKTKHRVTLTQAYGMTETSPLTLHQTLKMQNGLKIGGSGFVVSNTQAKIVPVDGSKEECLGPNQSGELVIKGPQVMKGYYKNPEATKEVLTGDGWIRTGDIGHFDEDEHFFITDRLKELIKVKGFQVAPAELEEILRDHPGVEDAAVVGIPHPLQGEAPKAFVVSKPGTSLKESHIEEYVAQKVAKHKHLVGGVKFVDAVPRNPSGKILRKILKNM